MSHSHVVHLSVHFLRCTNTIPRMILTRAAYDPIDLGSLFPSTTPLRPSLEFDVARQSPKETASMNHNHHLPGSPIGKRRDRSGRSRPVILDLRIPFPARAF